MMKNRFDLTGKRALVTGGARGLGRALAIGLAEAGADVLVASRNLPGCQKVVDEIRKLGRRGHALQVDMSSWEQTEHLAEAAFRSWGGIDIVVNNAGQTASILPATQVTAAYFTDVFAINVAGPLRLTARLVELVDKANTLSVINISSMGARRFVPGASVYAASKAAIEVITKVTALEWVDLGVRVNAIAPGPLQTDMVTAVDAVAPGTLAAVARLIPMKRIGDPDEIVGALLFLASDASSYVTGTVVSVNGGW